MTTNNIGSQWEVIKEDEDLIRQFPQFKKGFKFQVIGTDFENGRPDAFTAVVGLNDEGIISIKDNPGALWYCFYNKNDIDVQIERIQLSKVSVKDSIENSQIVLRAFNNRPVQITSALEAFAGQENCDAEEYDTMVKAASYIRWLEMQLAVQESRSSVPLPIKAS